MKFLVSHTYQEVTPESAADGEYSETGSVFQNEEYSLEELKSLIRREGFYREYRGSGWLTKGHYITCYRTATERSENLHIELLQ